MSYITTYRTNTEMMIDGTSAMEPDNGTTVSVALFKQTLRNALLALYFPPPEEQNGAYRE